MSVIGVFEPLAGQRPANATLPDPAAHELAAHEPAADECADECAAGGSGRFSLRCRGARPVSFSGRRLAQRGGPRPGAAVWHELSLFQTDAGRFVAAIQAATLALSEQPGEVRVCDTLEEAVAWFERYDPRDDVPAGFAIDDPTLSPVELLAHAAALRFRVSDATTRYRVALGMFLADLNAS